MQISKKRGAVETPFREGVNISAVKVITEPMFLGYKRSKFA